jgi:hypothetical protein
MRKCLPFLFLLSLWAMACIEAGTSTSINADGSGETVSEVDFSEVMGMLMAQKKNPEEKDMEVDTTAFMKDALADADFSEKERNLLKDAKIRFHFSSKESIFRIAIHTPFSKLEDYQAMTELMASEKFDKVFDKSIKGIGDDITGESQGDDGPNSNLFGFIFPDFLRYDYKKGVLKASVDNARFALFQEKWKGGEEGEDGAGMEQMMEAISFSNHIKLPAEASKAKGLNLKMGESKKEWVQSGSLLELMQQPGKYAYHIEY